MGILDSMFGSGQQEQAGPQQGLGVMDRLRANYAPNVYAAQQKNLEQQAIFNAAMRTPGLKPEIANALAMSPQYFNAQQQTFLPQPTNIMPLTNAQGEQIPYQVNNPGGAGGHAVSMYGVDIKPPGPGATNDPTQAAGGAPQPVKNSMQGLPGSTQETLDKIDALKAQNASREEILNAVPRAWRDLADRLVKGDILTKDLPARDVATRRGVLQTALALDPSFSETGNESRNKYRNSFNSPEGQHLGGQIRSLERLAGHAAAMGEAINQMPSVGLGGWTAPAHGINNAINKNFGGPLSTLQSGADKYTGEKSAYLSGKGLSAANEREERRAEYGGEKTPQEMGRSLLSDVDFIEKQIEGNERYRNEVWSNNSEAQRQFPQASPEARQLLNQAKIAGHKAKGDYEEWSHSEEGRKSLGTAAPVSEIRVDAQGRKWTRDAGGKVVPVQ